MSTIGVVVCSQVAAVVQVRERLNCIGRLAGRLSYMYVEGIAFDHEKIKMLNSDCSEQVKGNSRRARCDT
jgi:hypothetical protein